MAKREQMEPEPVAAEPKADTASVLPVPEPAPEPEPDSDADSGEKYRVVKAITLADGRTVMPGEEIDAGRLGPARRPKQLVDLGYLRAIKE